MKRVEWHPFVALVFLINALGVPQSAQAAVAVSDRLRQIREQVNEVEDRLVADLNTQKAASSALSRVRTLIKLQRQEAELAKERIRIIEGTLKELEQRRQALQSQIQREQSRIREGLVELDRSEKEPIRELGGLDREVVEAPRRKVLGRLAERGVRELEAYRIDLLDAQELSLKISEERNQLSFLLADLTEREEVLSFNQNLQQDLIRRKKSDRLRQLESYRRLKDSEARVEKMVGDFNARRELQQSLQAEKEAHRAMTKGEFARFQGKLNWPIEGASILSHFGRQLDSSSGLQVFRKGIELKTIPGGEVRSVFAGKVAFAGQMPGYGKLVIVDHGDQYYSLLGRLGDVVLKAGDAVATGTRIGKADVNSQSVYFEIRSRTVAVDPLQWLSH